MGFFSKLFAPGGALYEFGTAGPDHNENVFVGARSDVPAFTDGWYVAAEVKRAHRGRVGGAIVPQTVVVHTTDMPPNSFDPLIRAWQTSSGGGSCAHFVLDRGGRLVQMVPITRNANHAGGPNHNGKPIHGWWVTPEGRFIHPNSVSVGIEVHAAGLLRWGKSGGAEFVEDGKVKATFHDDEIYEDNLGRPWHAITKVQLDRLQLLLLRLKPALSPINAEPRADAAFIKDFKRGDTSYAMPLSSTLVGHVSLDPINKTDPGPQLMKFINEFAQKEGWE